MAGCVREAVGAGRISGPGLASRVAHRSATSPGNSVDTRTIREFTWTHARAFVPRGIIACRHGVDSPPTYE